MEAIIAYRPGDTTAFVGLSLDINTPDTTLPMDTPGHRFPRQSNGTPARAVRSTDSSLFVEKNGGKNSSLVTTLFRLHWPHDYDRALKRLPEACLDLCRAHSKRGRYAITLLGMRSY